MAFSFGAAAAGAADALADLQDRLQKQAALDFQHQMEQDRLKLERERLKIEKDQNDRAAKAADDARQKAAEERGKLALRILSGQASHGDHIKLQKTQKELLDAAAGGAAGSGFGEGLTYETTPNAETAEGNIPSHSLPQVAIPIASAGDALPGVGPQFDNPGVKDVSRVLMTPEDRDKVLADTKRQQLATSLKGITDRAAATRIALEAGVPYAQVDDVLNAYIGKPKTLTESEQMLDAYAKSIGKTDHTQLTYADRQQFEKNKAKITSDVAFQQHMRERDYDVAHPTKDSTPDQTKLENQYRTVLARGLSSRSGGLGLEDSKVQQANHLLALMDQNYDPKTGEYNIPAVMQGELALGLARLTSPGGQVGIELMRELNQKTAKGDLAGALSYITGHPFSGSTQDVFRMFKDSIQRQGEVALENREGEMRYLRGLAPTELDEERRQKLEANSLNPLRLSKIIQNKKTGERKVVVSIDGGKTWK